MVHSGQEKRPLKILRVIARLNIGGPARHVIYLTQRMNEGPFRTILVKGAEAEAEGTMEDLAEKRGVRCAYLPELGREIRAADDWVAFWKLFRLLRKERPDILHTHTAKAGALGRPAGWLYRWTTPGGRRMKVFHTFHGHVLRGYFGPLKSLVFRWMERVLARFTTRLITLSEGLRDEIAGLGVAPAGKITVVPLGLELAEFAAVEEGAGGDFRDSVGIPHGAFAVGIVGRLVPVKDHETLFEAVKLLIEGGLDAHLAVVGDGERREELEGLAKDILPAGRSHFAGWRFDLPGVYRGLDAVVLCSLNEGTPVSLIEALAASRPVVATAVGGVGDLLGRRGKGEGGGLPAGGWEAAERGLMIPPRDPAALAEALRSVRDDPEGARIRSRAGKRYVEARFGVERLVADLSALYQEDWGLPDG